MVGIWGQLMWASILSMSVVKGVRVRDKVAKKLNEREVSLSFGSRCSPEIHIYMCIYWTWLIATPKQQQKTKT